MALINDQGVHNYGPGLVARANLALKDKLSKLANYFLYPVLLGPKELNTTVAVYKTCFSNMIDLVNGQIMVVTEMLK